MQDTTGELKMHDMAMQFQAVQWEDHFNHLVTTLRSFTLLNTLTDTTLVTGNLKVSVHRVIISCYSSYLKHCLTNKILNCYILISDIEESLLHVLVSYIYTGVTSVPVSSLNDWYKTSKLLRLDGVLEAGRNDSSGDVTYFTWPQHQEMVLQYLWQSRSNPAECDVILVTDSFSQTYAHSCILGACSRHLLGIFVGHSERNRNKPYVLILQNVRSEDLEAVLEFCYRGTVSVFEGNISSIYDTAELLGIQNLCRKLISIDPMIKKMSEVNGRNYIASDVISRIKACHFSSQQDEHSLQLQNIFQHFFEFEDLVDITLLKGKQSFRAHIAILSAFSVYFKNLTKCLQHNIKDAFVLIKDLDTQHIQAFLDYVYKGIAEFSGTTEVFCEVMSDWIDFSMLSISESETCQILTNATPVMKQKTEFSESVEEQSIFHSDDILRPNMQQQGEILEKDETVQQGDCTGSGQDSRNLENVIVLEMSPSANVDALKELGPFEGNQGEEKEIETSVEEDWNNLKNECQMSVEDDLADGSTMPDEDEAMEAEDEAAENIPHKRWRGRDSILTCYTCNGNFESRKELREHLIIHPNGRVMKCNYCGKGFDRPSQMTLHIRTHTGSKPFSCKQCGHAFAAKSALRKHIDIHAKDKGKMFECAVCNKSFSRKEYLEEHIRTHTGNKPYECSICHKTFVGRTGLNHHKKTHADAYEKKDSMCEVCGKSFTRHALWTHVKSHEKTHSCHHCNKCFSTASALRVHITGTHLGCRSYQCEICGKGFVQKNHLIRHMKVHDNTRDMRNTKLFICGKCPRTFKTRTKLESHTRVEHIEPGERPYSCEICNKRFAGRSTVIYHRRAHTGERPHSCSTCGKKFMRPDALRQHIMCHTGERRHQCSVCSRKFTTRSTLNKHVQSHNETSEKQTAFSCDVCHKGFQSETQLSLHSRVHNSCRPLRCHVCHKSFRYQDSLTRHLNIHNVAQEDTPSSDLSCIYSFQVCGQTFELDNHTKECEDHSYRNVNLIHSSEKDMVPHSLQQYSISPAAENSNICLRDMNKATVAVPQRRPYSITIDGNLCCNTDAQNVDILPEVGNIDTSTELPSQLTSLHPLSHSHPGLDLHSVISLTSSHVHEQETRDHIEMTANPPVPYTEPLFIDNCSQISQEHSKQKMIHDSGRVYSKVET